VTMFVKLISLSDREPPMETEELPELRTHRRSKRVVDTQQPPRQQQQQHQDLSAMELVAARALGPLPPNNTELIKLLKERYLKPPTKEPYNLMLGQTGPLADNYNKYRTTFDSWETMYIMQK
ncbi:unnamed protein product, partial [Meganyctiphanes norvegica]